MKRNHELRELGERLILLSNREDEGASLKSEKHIDLPNEQDKYDELFLAQIARSFYKIRRSRIQFLPADLFAEPAWDMLLDLFIQRSMGRRVSVTSLCIASGVPPTTALRWVSGLIENELVVRIESDQDRRKAYIVLTEKGFRAMRSVLIDANRHFQPRQLPFMLAEWASPL